MNANVAACCGNNWLQTNPIHQLKRWRYAFIVFTTCFHCLQVAKIWVNAGLKEPLHCQLMSNHSSETKFDLRPALWVCVEVEVAGACMYAMNILQRGLCSQGAMRSEACKLIRAEELQTCMCMCASVQVCVLFGGDCEWFALFGFFYAYSSQDSYRVCRPNTRP